MWKRFAAEVLDFCLLFGLKLAVTFIVVETLGVIDLDSFMAK